MLKNKIWIVALLAALTIGLIGCTNAAFDWEPPTEQLDDNALQVVTKDTYVGIDLNDSHFSFAAGDIIQVTGKTLGKNKMNFHVGESGADLFWEQNCAPDEEFDSEKVALTAAQATSANGVGFIRVQGNTNGATYIIYNITVTRGDEEIFNLYEKFLKSLKPGEQDRTKIFDGMVGATENHGEGWISPADNGGATAVWTILGPGYGGAEADDQDPEYTGGDLTKAGNNIKFTKGTTLLYNFGTTAADDVYNDKVEDFDPHVIGSGAGVSIDDDGLVTFDNKATSNSGGSVRYKFPESYYTNTTASKVRWDKNALDLEGDYDNIAIDFEVTNYNFPASSQSAGGTNTDKFKAKIVHYDAGWDPGVSGAYGVNMTASNWADLGTTVNGRLDSTLNVQTWGAGGKGGIEIHLNAGDLGAGKMNLKIKKVTFTKGVRFKVQFFTPQTPGVNDIASIPVFTGNALGSKLPKPANPGWTFLGWYTQWDTVSQNTTNTGTLASGVGTKVTETTGITADMKLYAGWMSFIPDPIIVPVTPATSTLLTGDVVRDSGWSPITTDNETRYTYDGKAWDVVYPWNNDADFGPWTKGTLTIPARAEGTGFYSITLPTGYNVGYNKVKITYDLVMLADGAALVNLVAGTSWWSDASLPALSEGTGKELVLNIADCAAAPDIHFRQGGYRDGGGAFLWRVTEVEVYFE